MPSHPAPELLHLLDAAGLQALRSAWAWRLGEVWQPLMASVIGDVFVLTPAGSVWWLSTASGDLEQVADSPADFRARLSDPEAQDEWFLPGLVHALQEQGKTLLPGQLYGYSVLPVFEGGSFSVENMLPVDAAAHYTLSGELLRAAARRRPGEALGAVSLGD